MKGLDLEPTGNLLALLDRGLRRAGNDLGCLSGEVADMQPELGDRVALVGSELDRVRAIVEVLRSRNSFTGGNSCAPVGGSINAHSKSRKA